MKCVSYSMQNEYMITTTVRNPLNVTSEYMVIWIEKPFRNITVVRIDVNHIPHETTYFYLHHERPLPNGFIDIFYGHGSVNTMTLTFNETSLEAKFDNE